MSSVLSESVNDEAKQLIPNTKIACMNDVTNIHIRKWIEHTHSV